LPTVVAPSAIARLARRGYATEAEEKDLIVIGGGVAGYVAAIKAAQLGLKVLDTWKLLECYLTARTGYLYREAWHIRRNMS